MIIMKMVNGDNNYNNNKINIQQINNDDVIFSLFSPCFLKGTYTSITYIYWDMTSFGIEYYVQLVVTVKIKESRVHLFKALLA